MTHLRNSWRLVERHLTNNGIIVEQSSLKVTGVEQG